MKYLHSGYILFCHKAEYTENGDVNALGLFDIFAVPSLPAKVRNYWIIGFGTPFERRQYKGLITLENPSGKVVYSEAFQANDPASLCSGYYLVRPEIVLDSEGLWTAKVTLQGAKDDSVWDVERHFWTMVKEG